MLQAPADFPHVGSYGFLVGTAEPVRIQRRNGDGTCLVSLTDRKFPRETASGNRTVPETDLAATEHDAITFNGAKSLPKQRRRTRSAR